MKSRIKSKPELPTLLNTTFSQTKTMSIYGGFPTRKLESDYNSLLESMLTLLQSQILSLIKIGVQESSDYFKASFSQIFHQLTQYEQRKYYHPKFSTSLMPLALQLQILIEQPLKQTETKDYQNKEKVKVINATPSKISKQGKVRKCSKETLSDSQSWGSQTLTEFSPKLSTATTISKRSSPCCMLDLNTISRPVSSFKTTESISFMNDCTSEEEDDISNSIKLSNMLRRKIRVQFQAINPYSDTAAAAVADEDPNQFEQPSVFGLRELHRKSPKTPIIYNIPKQSETIALSQLLERQEPEIQGFIQDTPDDQAGNQLQYLLKRPKCGGGETTPHNQTSSIMKSPNEKSLRNKSLAYTSESLMEQVYSTVPSHVQTLFNSPHTSKQTKSFNHTSGALDSQKKDRKNLKSPSSSKKLYNQDVIIDTLLCCSKERSIDCETISGKDKHNRKNGRSDTCLMFYDSGNIANRIGTIIGEIGSRQRSVSFKE